MIMDKAFLDRLKEFGLNSYESKLWTALLSRSQSTAGELADISGVPRSRSYDVLEGLQKKGFIVMKSTKPIKYVAVSPSEVLSRIKTKIITQTKDQIVKLESKDSEKILDELNLLHSRGTDTIEPTEFSGSLKGRENIFHHLGMLIKSAKKSVTIMTTASGFERKINLLKPELEKARKRGVSVNFILPKTKAAKTLASKYKRVARISHTNTLGRLSIVDNSEVMFMLMNDADIHKSYDTAVWVSTPYFASTLSNMVQTHLKM